MRLLNVRSLSPTYKVYSVTVAATRNCDIQSQWSNLTTLRPALTATTTAKINNNNLVNFFDQGKKIDYLKSSNQKRTSSLVNFVVHITIDNFLIMKNIYDQKISSPKEFNHSKISFISLIRANLLCTVSTHRLFLRDTRRNRTIDINRFLDLLFPEEQSMLVD